MTGENQGEADSPLRSWEDASPRQSGGVDSLEDLGEGATAADEATELTPEEAELARLTRERDDYLDALRRLQAEFENYRKRVAKQQSEQIDRAAEGLLQKLLPVIDTLDLALLHIGGDDSAAVHGAAQAGALSQVATALTDALGKEGLERIDPIGMAFSPVEHDAVAHEDGDGIDGGPEVVEVLRSGWRWRGRVLRPAMVRVRG